MHQSTYLRMEWFIKTFLNLDADRKLKVLDVGSCDVNGTYRNLFPENTFEYTGLDVAKGKNVDIIPKNPYHWIEISDNEYDVVISGQALEHIEFFWVTAEEMARVLKPGGLLCLIVPRGFARHRYPVDCYRFDADGMNAIARWCNLRTLHASTDLNPPGCADTWHRKNSEDSMLVAMKPFDWSGRIDVTHYKFTVPDIKALGYPLNNC